MDEVNERGTWITTVAFVDENDAPVTPTSALYRIDDLGSLARVRANTALTGLSTSKEITWTESDTVILDSTRPYETRRLTVWYEWATGQNSISYLLNVVNQGGISETSPA